MIRGLAQLKKRPTPIPSPIDLRSVIGEHNSLIQTVQEKKATLEQILNDATSKHESFITEVENKLAYLDQVIADVRTIQKGDKGDSPIPGVDFPIPQDGKSVDHAQVVEEVLARIPPPKEVAAPVVDHKAIAKEVVKMIVIPKPKNGKDGVAPTIEEIMAYLKDNLKVEHIPGLKNEIASYRNQFAGKVYGKDTWARGGGDRVKAGSNITVTDNSDGTRTIAAQAGFTLLAPTGTVDGSNTTFVFTRAPSIIVVDGGRAMQKTSSDGTANWTGTTTVVLTIAPNFDIYGF